MNGLNTIGGTNATPNSSATGPDAADASGFEEAFATQAVTTGAVLMQFIGADILESVMKSETSVD